MFHRVLTLGLSGSEADLFVHSDLSGLVEAKRFIQHRNVDTSSDTTLGGHFTPAYRNKQYVDNIN